MQIPILIERVSVDLYRARSGEPLAASAEGATPEEAKRKLREALVARFAAGGVWMEMLDLPEAENPWLRVAGMYKDDPYFDEWQKEIAERRREIDADPDPHAI
jgi:hypothetical protein